MMEGWVKIYRKIAEKGYYKKDSEKVHLWLHLIIKATHDGKDEVFAGKPIHLNPGQLTTGRKQLSIETGISESKIERILTYFEKIELQIEQRKCNINRLISILNWNGYQKTEQQPNNKMTKIEQQTEQQKQGLNNTESIINKGTNNKTEQQTEQQNDENRTHYKNVLKKKKDIYSFVSENFSEVWLKWIEYKRDIHKPYKTENGMKKKYSELIIVSENNPEMALKIVQQSIDNEWSGFFTLKSGSKYSTKYPKPETASFGKSGRKLEDIK